MKQNIQGLLCLLATVLLVACQSNDAPPPTIISNSFTQEAEPRILSLPGIATCGGIVKSNIEAIYTGSWRDKTGEAALPHTLVIMKPDGLSNTVYFASDIWKPWGIKKPSCEFVDVIRNGNSITLGSTLAGNKVSARYQLNSGTATGELTINSKTWPITMTRYWADGIDELGSFEPAVEAPQF